MNSGHGKRNAYTTDFKIKVLEHFIKNGGEKVFGLKAKTALHFNIGKKTVHRIVESKQSLLRAKATKSKKTVAPAAKPVVSSTVSKGVGSKSVVNKTINKVLGAAKTGTTTKTGTTNSTASAAKHSTLPSKAVSAVHSNKSTLISKPASSLTKTTITKTATASKEVISNTSSKNDEEETLQSHEEEEVLDLPEDPDFSVLKLPIAGGVSATGVAGPAMLLSTATDEVRHALVHECELLYECRVCRNLFRSVVNFLAHKRIFCTQHYSESRSLYPEGQASQFTPHSSTVMEESDQTSDGKCSVRASHRQRGAARHTSSSDYYTRLAGLERKRAVRSKDCSVNLQGIAGTNSAVYQTFRHPDHANPSQPSLQRGREMVRIHEHGVMAVLNENGAVAATVSLDSSGHQDIAMEMDSKQHNASDSAAVKTEVEEEEELEDEEEEEEEEVEEKDGSFVCSELRHAITSKSTTDGRASQRTLQSNLDSDAESTYLPSGGRIFAGDKYLRTHLKNVHGAERTVFSCPICETKFLSLWATGKHLQRSHNKTKSQIDHLRNTIKKNSYKEKNVRTPTKAAGKAQPDVHLHNNNNNNNDGKNEDSALDPSVEIKKEIDDEMLEREAVEGSAALGPIKSPSSSEPGSATKAPLGGEEEDREGIMRGVQSRVVHSRRWMCNVCRKLHVTHTASLAHAATHTDCTFMPKPQLVQVILNRKAFSKPVLPPSLPSTGGESAADGALQGPGDLVLPDSVEPSKDRSKIGPADLVRFNTGTVVTMINSAEGADAMEASNGIIDITDDSPMTHIEVTASDSVKSTPSANSVTALSDNVAFTISRTNNLSWRESNIPFQSMDQKSALERSIERIYQRQKGCNEPKVHELLLHRWQSLMSTNKSSPPCSPSRPPATDAVAATGTTVAKGAVVATGAVVVKGAAVRGSVNPGKRKLNMALSSYATKISKLNRDDTVHSNAQRKPSKALSFTGLIGGKVSSVSKVDQRCTAPVKTNKKVPVVSFTRNIIGTPTKATVPVSKKLPATSRISSADPNISVITASSITKKISPVIGTKFSSADNVTTFKNPSYSLNSNDSLEVEMKSPEPSSSKSIPAPQQENENSKSKVWSLFEADWNDDEDEDDAELLSLTSTGQRSKSPELPDITGGKSSDVGESCGTSRVLSPDEFSTKNELVSTPDSMPSSSCIKSSSYDARVASSSTPSIRSEDISSDSCSSSIVSINEDRSKYEHSGSSIQSSHGETSSSAKGMESKMNRKQTDPVSAVPMKRPVRQKNLKAVDESAMTFKLKSHFSHFIEQRASSVILDRRKTETDSTRSAQSSPGRKHFSGLLDRSPMSRSHGKSDSTFQPFNKTTNSGHRSLSCQPLGSSSLAKKIQPTPKFPSNADEDDDMKLFDCGSMAEQAYDATKDSASSTSKSPDIIEVKPDTDCSSVPDTCATPDVVPRRSPGDRQNDTVLTTASNLGLFDTGFEECRLHVVDERELKEEPTTDAEDISVIAGPSRSAADHR